MVYQKKIWSVNLVYGTCVPHLFCEHCQRKKTKEDLYKDPHIGVLFRIFIMLIAEVLADSQGIWLQAQTLVLADAHLKL